jgi:hypothetical protein
VKRVIVGHRGLVSINRLTAAGRTLQPAHRDGRKEGLILTGREFFSTGRGVLRRDSRPSQELGRVRARFESIAPGMAIAPC